MNKKINKEFIARKNILRDSEEIKGVPIKGYDFNEGIDYESLLNSFSSTGFQASHFAKAKEIINKMISDKAFIFLGYTSNMVSSGLREIIRYLVEHKKVNVLVTTAGGVEEDIIKCLGNFILGDFRASGKELRKKGINRIGNIFVPNNRYIEFEKFFQIILKELFEEQKKTFEKLKEHINDKIGLIVFDSVAMLYRLELGKTEDVYETNRELGKQLAYLKEIASKKQIPVLITNQVYADFEEKDKVNIVGGDLLKYGSKCLMELQITPSGNRRIIIKKHRHIPANREIIFKIVEGGIIGTKEG